MVLFVLLKGFCGIVFCLFGLNVSICLIGGLLVVVYLLVILVIVRFVLKKVVFFIVIIWYNCFVFVNNWKVFVIVRGR